MLLDQSGASRIEPGCRRTDRRRALCIRHAAGQVRVRRGPPGLCAQDNHRTQGGFPQPQDRGRHQRLPQPRRERVRLLRRRPLLDFNLRGPGLCGGRETAGAAPQGHSPYRRRRDDRRTGVRGAEQCRSRQGRHAHTAERQQPVHREQHRRDARIPAQHHDEQFLQPAQGQDMAPARRRALQGLHPALGAQPQVVVREKYRRGCIRVARHQILRSDRRQRHSRSGKSAAQAQGHGRAPHTALHDGKGEGLRTGRERSGHLACPRQVRPRNRTEDRHRIRQGPLSGCFRPGAAAARRNGPESSRNHPGNGPGLRNEPARRTQARAVLRCPSPRGRTTR